MEDLGINTVTDGHNIQVNLLFLPGKRDVQYFMKNCFGLTEAQTVSDEKDRFWASLGQITLDTKIINKQ